MTRPVAGNSDVSTWEALLKRLLCPLTAAAWAAVVSVGAAVFRVPPGLAIQNPDLSRRLVE